MKTKFLTCILAASIMLSGCSFTSTDIAPQGATEDGSESVAGGTAEANDQGASGSGAVSGRISLLGSEETIYYDQNLVPSIPAYSVNEDFSNVVVNSRQAYRFDLANQSEYNDVQGLRNALIKNNFAIDSDGSDEFFEIYEGNRYSMTPSFITVDSLMHTYHLYFAYLMKQTEKNYLTGELKELSQQMLDASVEQYNELKGTDFESAALRNVAFFYIGSKLLDDSVTAPISDGSFDETVQAEISKILDAEGIVPCQITGRDEDYSQYKPRGYYEGDPELEKYFRAMMWYGRIAYAFDTEDMVRSAVLQTIAIDGNQENWNSIYGVTSFFAGASDDPGFSEMSQIVSSCYGSIPSSSDVASNKDAFAKVCSAVKELKLPEINSVPVVDGEDPVVPSYRFMGQRFTVDAAIMQKLVYSAVKENGQGEARMLPDVLDTAAALGSEKAMEILTEQGATEFKNYTDNMTIVKDHFNNNDPAIWNASLYSGWLNTLRPLFEKKGEGYPMYMQNDEWVKKNLETYAGSYAELKHDTILYSKQILAEMGDGDEDIPDDRGYVDPQPVIYSRFKFLAEKTKEGLDAMALLDDSAKEDLDKLSEIAGTLLTISEKELKNESLSDEDYEFIRCYGGYIEHFWKEAAEDAAGEGVSTQEAPCPIIADIATDPNGTVLEVGTGRADLMYVVFPIDGELHVGTGSVYSFYQFEQPISNRLTDTQWREALKGGHLDDDWNWVESTETYSQPAWTQSYRLGN